MRKQPDWSRVVGTGPKLYNFNPDSVEVLSSKGDVSFIMALNRDVDPNNVREVIEGLAQNIGYVNYIPGACGLVCTTDKETYEEFFRAELQKGDGPAGRKTLECYSELQHAKVPDELCDMVSSIDLNIVR
ncbi:hypothetical protein HOA55_02455 [archaeon]|jgi:hypothetical protein|nr:hypothetical protein [archaeon]MBT3577840.1 hypothetical protein [archaeon]MBT6820191.1 hypothetical protein [archaeon]MBT6955778.1 hypothetical protein [archaeon]MBT7025302.1 hypothetical protein [archaeon]